jgi:Putative prokaryotic signal transducing protein
MRVALQTPATPEMITLRTYPSFTEAGLAKAHLDAAGIDCELADENANSNTIAQFAIPIRLMVAEDRVDEARNVLDSQAVNESE